MTIRTDIDAAIAVEADKRASGKRPKSTAALVLGEPARRELGRQLGTTIEAGHDYRGFTVELTDQFEGWELRA